MDRTAPTQRIVVVGGGIAGAETALTLAAGLPSATVTLVGRWPSLRLMPELVYVPFGVAPRRLDVPLADLVPHGVRSVVAEVERIDVTARVVATSRGPVPYDVLVAAPGAEPVLPAHDGLRTLDDALRVRGQLEELLAAATSGERATITISAAGDDAWTAPACELALLVGAWIRARRLGDRITTTLVTPDQAAFEWFGPTGESAVDAALRRARVRVETGVPEGREDESTGDLTVRFGRLQPRRIPGLPGVGASGWYETAEDLTVAPGAFVVGDALDLPWRAAFASAWQARSILRTLGGDPGRLGIIAAGHEAEYQMDLADGVLRARVGRAGALASRFLGHDADVDVIPGARPDKLAGLVLHERVLRWSAPTHDAPLAWRDSLREPDVA